MPDSKKSPLSRYIFMDTTYTTTYIYIQFYIGYITLLRTFVTTYKARTTTEKKNYPDKSKSKLKSKKENTHTRRLKKKNIHLLTD